MRRFLFLFCLAIGMAFPVWAQPQRVVSLNLCTDQLVVTMLPPEQVLGVSFNAADAALSLVAEAAERYRSLRGSIEEMAEIQPDMVLLGTGQNARLQAWLKERHVPFVEIGMPDSITALHQDTRRIAAAIGQSDKAKNLISRQNAVLARTTLPRPGMTVAIYYPRGFSDGRNTLLNDIITHMGGKNVAAEQGREGMSYLSLEELVALSPELLVIPLYDYDIVSQAEAVAQHPALRDISARVVPLPGQYLTCPHLGLEAIINTLALAAANRSEGK